MCVICAEFQPFKAGCDYAGLDPQEPLGMTSGQDATQMTSQETPFTTAQIARVLTDGYWNDSARTRRSFDVEEGDTLTYDVSSLTSAGRTLAEFALQAWSDILGVTFSQFGLSEFTDRTEASTVGSGSDAGNTNETAGVIRVGERVSGNQASASDEDWYRLDMAAGQTVTITLTGLSHPDTYLRLFDSLGKQVAFNDDFSGLNSQITFTAEVPGAYYIEADGYSTNSGTYELIVSEGSASNSAHITFDDEDSGAYSTSETTGSTISSSFVNVSTAWLNGNGTSLDSYSFQTYIHEIGHALGLGHAGFYNGGAVYGQDNHYQNDSWQSSIMSYFDQSDNTSINASLASVITPMIADIAAIEDLYGTVAIRDGNTVYGANSNVEGYLGTLFGVLFDGQPNSDLYTGSDVTFTIADTGGVDTLDLSTVTASQRIDLSAGAISDIDGLTGNLVIAQNTIIERFEGGTGIDIVVGNSANNVLNGNSGSDILRGFTGNDTVAGGSGHDTLYGGSGNDRVFGGTGDDTLIGSSGQDRLDGNDGEDLLYGGSKADQLRGHDGVDRLWGEADSDYLSGGTGNDFLYGGDARDYLYGGRDNDRIEGEAGSDRLYGQSGNDTLFGGSETDWLYGGTGDDFFLFGKNSDKDLVRDFENNKDTVLIDDNLWTGEKTAQDVIDDYGERVGADVVFDFGNGDILIVENSNFSALSNDIEIV